MTATPPVSVLLPAWNEAATLGRCLDSLLAIAWPELEIVVCAGGWDGTLPIAERYAAAHPGRVVALEQHRGDGKQVALRRCLAHARHDWFYFTDADCVVPEATFRAVISPVIAGEVDAATGPSEPLPEQRRLPLVRHQWATGRDVDRRRGPVATGLLGRNFAIGRAGVAIAGNLREDVRLGTDYHLAVRLLEAGGTIRFVPAPVQSRYHEQIGPYLRQQSRWLRNTLLHGWRYRDAGELRGSGRTVALGTAILGWPVTWPWTRWAGVGPWAVIVAALVAARVGRGRRLDRETGDPSPPLPLAVGYAGRHTVVDLLVWTRPVLDLAIRRRRLRW